MASAARAYAVAQPRREPEIPSRPDLKVIPGRGRGLSEQLGVGPTFFTVLKVLVAAVIFMAAVGICRVNLTAATVQTMISSETLTSQIDEARSTGNELAVQQTVLANPTRIQTYASEKLGMVKATTTSYIDLSHDALATDASGNLSLSGTVAALDGTATGETTMLAESDSATENS